MGCAFNQFSVLVEVFKYLFDGPRIFDTRDNLDSTAAMLTGFNVDVA